MRVTPIFLLLSVEHTFITHARNYLSNNMILIRTCPSSSPKESEFTEDLMKVPVSSLAVFWEYFFEH